MSHEIETMFSVKETPWHGLGTIVQEAPTTADAIKLAGLDWRVKTVPLFITSHSSDAEVGESVNYNGPATRVGAQAVVRESDGRVLGQHVGPTWTPLQNTEAFGWFDPLIQAGDCRLETAGSLREGERVWVLAAINTPAAVIGRNDEVKSFLLLSNSHDGSLAIRVGFTPIRVVCANTLAMAHGDSASKLLRVRHTKNVVKTLEVLRDTINVLTQEFQATAEQYRFLASKRVNPADLRKYMKVVLGLSDSKKAEGELTTRSKNIMAAVLENFNGGKGANLESSRGTWWGAYNAVTEYLSYTRGRNDNNRLNALWFGDAANLNRAAFTTALELATAA
jgi:phage/plasmid-like protein (TIGR03299 family)